MMQSAGEAGGIPVLQSAWDEDDGGTGGWRKRNGHGKGTHEVLTPLDTTGLRWLH